MSLVEESVLLQAAPKAVFDYIANVSNHPALVGALKDVRNLSGDPRKKGTTWDWTFEMAEVQLEGESDAAECVDGRRFSYRTTSGTESTFTYEVEAENDVAPLTIRV